MSIIHTVIQSKSVGKTIAAMTLAHYLRDERKKTVLCLDTDTLNDSLASFTALQAVKVEIPALADYCRTISPEIEHVVMDTSISGFLPFCSGLRDAFLPALTEAGHSLHLHTVVTGGASALDTFNGFRTLAGNFPDLPITIWLNPFWGEVALQGRPFEDCKVYQEHIHSVHSLIRMRDNNSLAVEDMTRMLIRRLTFKEVNESDEFSIVPRTRILRIWNHMIEQLDCAAICE
ncbi:hypothetical protein [Desulfovibrio desulfuricans]|uniref:hypothetical protein n=1 Tax=Desulfovibrio desulfuricans TaxID=876 RepID=UPI0035B17663